MLLTRQGGWGVYGLSRQSLAGGCWGRAGGSLFPPALPVPWRRGMLVKGLGWAWSAFTRGHVHSVSTHAHGRAQILLGHRQVQSELV